MYNYKDKLICLVLIILRFVDILYSLLPETLYSRLSRTMDVGTLIGNETMPRICKTCCITLLHLSTHKIQRFYDDNNHKLKKNVVMAGFHVRGSNRLAPKSDRIEFFKLTCLQIDYYNVEVYCWLKHNSRSWDAMPDSTKVCHNNNNEINMPN
jgi:hypothetical protein